MEQRIKNESTIIKYLLGELPEEEQERIETRYADDDDFYEEICITESELIDKYLQGELFDKEREQFEVCFLNSPSRRKRVENARVMMKWLAKERYAYATVAPHINREPRSWLQSLAAFWDYRRFRWAAGIAIVVIAFTASWIIISSLRPPSESPQQKVSLDLTPDAVRSSNEPRTLRISPDIGVVEFDLHLDKSIRGRLIATLQTSTEKILQKELAPEPQQTTSGKVFILSVPANIFSGGEYFITLANEDDKGTQDIIAEYEFKVVKRK